MILPLFRLVKPALFCLDAEKAHRLSIKALKTGLVGRPPLPTNPKLKQSVFGLDFTNPVGLAAGYDKNAEVILPILNLGFAATEVGTLTPLPQPGNPKPRVFRLESDLAVINRLGFNNDGHAAAVERLISLKSRKPGILGINIGANKSSQDFIADYETGLERFWQYADYFTANISSPNTPGLRDLQAKSALTEMLVRLRDKQEKLTSATKLRKPILLKIAPDLDEHQMDDIATVVNESALDGVIISNTTIDRPAKLKSTSKTETGGLSGRPLFELSTIVLAKMRAKVDQAKPIIGVGGIHDTETAIQKLAAGASLIQLYSGMIYAGPDLPSSIIKGLSQHLETSQLEHISDLIGSQNQYWANKTLPVG